ncbi:hypothetical protein GCM10009422_10390 [Brevundimonas kwangchunensis]|uniref:Polysaccharide biosynthesis protein GumN n=1 Tax=Brevundimonas kwangchunensis TaxID=322163 RepID=A0ABN1GR88_9CAUL
MKSVAVAVCLFTALLTGSAAIAQETEPADRLDDVIITAQRSGAPMWTVRDGDSVLILVGSIRAIPREVTWRPEALEEAAKRADLILLPQEGRASFSDILRVIWRARTITFMPEGQTTATYLSPDMQARLDVLMAGERNQDWRRRSMLMTSFDLIQDRAGFRAGREGRDAVDVVRRAARQGRIQARPVGTVRGDEMVDSLITAPQTVHVPCMERAIAAAEAGPESSRERAQDWRAFRVPEVVASPIEQALKVCWPWGDPELAPQLHQQWAAAVQTALVSPGVTMGVAPVRLLAEPGGVLDSLEARGLEVEGPEWK